MNVILRLSDGRRRQGAFIARWAWLASWQANDRESLGELGKTFYQCSKRCSNKVRLLHRMAELFRVTTQDSELETGKAGRLLKLEPS